MSASSTCANDAWVADTLERRDVDASPTSEHYTRCSSPSAPGNDTSPVQATIDGYAMGLAKRSFQIA